MSGSSEKANVNFPVVAGGFLPGALAVGSRAQNVQGCSAIVNVGPYWAVTLDAPIPAGRAIVLCSMEADIGAPPLFVSANYSVASESVVNFLLTKSDGTQAINTGISFLILQMPNIV